MTAFKGIADGAELEFTCPKCSNKFKKSVGWLRNNSDYTCTCGTIFKTDKLAGDFAKVDEAIRQFGKDISRPRR